MGAFSPICDDGGYKPDVTSPDYQAGKKAGYEMGKLETLRMVQGKLVQLQRQAKTPQGRAALKAFWQRIK